MDAYIYISRNNIRVNATINLDRGVNHRNGIPIIGATKITKIMEK